MVNNTTKKVVKKIRRIRNNGSFIDVLYVLSIGIISALIATWLYAQVVYPIVTSKPSILLLCAGSPFVVNNGSTVDSTQIDIINQGSGPAAYFDIQIQTNGSISKYFFVENFGDFRVVNTTIPHGYSLELISQVPIWPESHTQFVIDTIGNIGITHLIINSSDSSYRIDNATNYGTQILKECP